MNSARQCAFRYIHFDKQGICHCSPGDTEYAESHFIRRSERSPCANSGHRRSSNHRAIQNRQNYSDSNGAASDIRIKRNTRAVSTYFCLRLMLRSPQLQRSTSLPPLMGDTQRNSMHVGLMHCIDCSSSRNAATMLRIPPSGRWPIDYSGWLY